MEIDKSKLTHIGSISPLTAIRHGEYFTITPKLRYKKKEIDLGNGTYKTEYRLQQMWQGSEGTEEWQWIEYID